MTFNFGQIRGQKKKSIWYMDLPIKTIITANSIILSGEGKRRNEFAEWYVEWRAEWHNYAKYDLRGK